jgi:hypothetical protein
MGFDERNIASALVGMLPGVWSFIWRNEAFYGTDCILKYLDNLYERPLVPNSVIA